MKGSIYAKEIDQEYRRKKYYENRIKREKCKNKKCNKFLEKEEKQCKE